MKTLLTQLILLTLNSFTLFAQWQPDVRLTNNPANSYMSVNNARCVAANGDNVHVVWRDYRDGNWEIYNKLSTDGGLSWGADTRLTNNSAISHNPSVAISGQVVHIIWIDFRDGNFEIYYKRSADAGVSWGQDTRLTIDTASSGDPSLSVSGSVVHVVWYDNRNGNYEIYYKRSTDAGISWGADTRLTNDPAFSFNPCISVSGTAVHVVWHDNRDGNYEIYYKRSTDSGINWGQDTRLTNNSASSWSPCVSTSGQIVHLVWVDNRDGNYEIYYKRSTDAGISWRTDARLTSNTDTSWYPFVSASGSNIHIVWADKRDGNYEIYYKRSTDGGLSWEPDTRITNNPAASDYPFAAVSGSVVHVVWQDNRDGNYEIYYKRNPTGNPIGIININSEIPKEFSLYQNYPNPFNASTKIKFDIPSNVKRETSNVKITVYDVLGKEVAVLLNEELKPGTYEISWDASNYPSGVYYYKFNSADFTETKKMVLIK